MNTYIPFLTTVIIVLIMMIGGILAIVLLAKEEKDYLGGKLLSHVLEDIKESPIAATVGYSLTFLCGWLYVVGIIIAKKKQSREKANKALR